MRDALNKALKEAMLVKDKDRLSTLRLINAAIKDQDIEARAGGNADGVSDDRILSILAKMVKQRTESAQTYEEAARLELAEKERAEIAVIEEFLPRQLSEEEIEEAIKSAIADVKATSIRDMGKVMGLLKGQYAGRMDFGQVGARLKDQLN